VIDGESVPPATSPWTFLVPALGAFLGVVLAQWWTTRREDRNWNRQLQMYATQWEDQRERDKEQREDQRQRDRELWARENRYRFADYKRELYVRQLTTLRASHDAALDLVSKTDAAKRQGGASEGNVDKVAELIESFRKDLREKNDVAILAHHEILLFGHPSVQSAAGKLLALLIDVQYAFLTEFDLKKSKELLDKYDIGPLVIAMHVDLGH
jgi:hypothetical protein